MPHHRRLMPLILAMALAVLITPATAVAEPPYCSGGEFRVTQGEPPLLLLSADMEPCWDPEEEEYTLELVTLPAHGTLINDENGVSYEAQPGFRGIDTFTYRATDVNGEQSEPAQVWLYVGASPRCTDTALRARPGERLAIRFRCDSVAGATLTAMIVALPTHGTLVPAADPMAATYFPRPGYTGPDEVLFSVQDELGFVSEVHKVAITVTAAPAGGGGGGGGGGGAVTPPGPKTAVLGDLAARTGLAAARRRGVRVSFTAGRSGTADVRLTVTRRTARRLGLRPGEAGRITVGRRRISVVRGGNAVRVPLTRRARRAMTRARRVVLTVSVTLRDDARNRATERIVVTLTR